MTLKNFLEPPRTFNNSFSHDLGDFFGKKKSQTALIEVIISDFPIFSNQSRNKLNFIFLFSLVTNKWTISPLDFYFYNIEPWYLDTDCGLDIEET